MQTRYQVLIKDGKLVACLHEAASAMAMANRLRDPEGGRVLDSWTGWTYYPLAGWISPDGTEQRPSYRLPTVSEVTPEIPKLL
jgi:hypothetical protein